MSPLRPPKAPSSQATRERVLRTLRENEAAAIARGASRSEVWLAGHALPSGDRS